MSGRTSPWMWVLGLSPVALFMAAGGIFLVMASGLAAYSSSSQQRGVPTAQGSPAKVDSVPPEMLAAYNRAAAEITSVRPKCKGMRWSVLAGIGKVESGHAGGRTVSASGAINPRIIGVRLDGSGAGGNTTAFTDTDNGRWDGDTAYDRAVGPMQFLPSTWNGATGQDGNNDGTKDPHNAFDAALGTAAYLCGRGPADLNDQAQLRKAILRYNHANWYADKVLRFVRTYDAAGPAGANGSSTWAKPVDGALGTRYGVAGSSWSSGRHTGIDYPVPTGTAVRAAGTGTVTSAGPGGAYGNQVVVRHPDGHFSQYAHLSRIDVAKGDQVKVGQQIGPSGETGNAHGPHLHFEIRTGPGYGSDIDPVAFLRRHGVRP